MRLAKLALILCLGIGVLTVSPAPSQELGEFVRDPLPEDFEGPVEPVDIWERAEILISMALGYAQDWEMIPGGDRHDLNQWLNWLGTRIVFYRNNTPEAHPNYQFLMEACDELQTQITEADSILYMDLVGAQANHEQSKARAEYGQEILDGNYPDDFPDEASQADAALAEGEAAIEKLDKRIEDQNQVINRINNGQMLEEEMFNAYWVSWDPEE